jgi:hypothetical protein
MDRTEVPTGPDSRGTKFTNRGLPVETKCLPVEEQRVEVKRVSSRVGSCLRYREELDSGKVRERLVIEPPDLTAAKIHLLNAGELVNPE